ncbi:MAG: lipocalin-like domain-containing protein [Vicinamibacterales bacterium]
MRLATLSASSLLLVFLLWPSGPWRRGTIALAQQGAAAGPAAAPRSSEADWKRAEPGRRIVLPDDHASHPAYKLEWWYYTGNLDSDDGRRFGFQVTFFRVGVDPSPENPSRWAVRDLIMTHLALTDASGKRYLYAERLNRPGPGWAGAAVDRYRVWNEDWQVALEGRTHRITAHGTSEPRGAGAAVRFGLDLVLDETQPPALHGDRGYSRKGSDPGNASHYYSLPRMPTRGTITLDGRTLTVTGLSWMDHEFGTSFLEAGQIGWDWFAIQLTDGRSLMLYRFRRSDGVRDPRSSGTLIEADGRTSTVDFGQVAISPGRTWVSPVSGAVYPVTWDVSLPRERLTLLVSAVLDDQELHTSESTGVTYWEGAVDVRGTADGQPVAGRGYLEMTGYAGATMANYLR